MLPFSNSSISPEDYGQFIAALKEILGNALPGFLSKFARVVSALQQERVEKLNQDSLRMPLSESVEADAKTLLCTYDDSLHEPKTSARVRFNAALKIAKRRDNCAGEKFSVDLPKKGSITAINFYLNFPYFLQSTQFYSKQ